MKATLHTDGACLGNPGPMGLGIVLQPENDMAVEKSIPHGIGTNNVAEYSALIKGLEVASEQGITEIDAYLDSQLVVEQVKGNWRVKDERLQQLHQAVKALLSRFDNWAVTHVPREQNARADALSKRAAERNN